MSKKNTVHIYVRWEGNNDPIHDGRYNCIQKDMIAIPSPSKLKVGTKIETKPWPKKKFFGIIVEPSEAAKNQNEKRKKKQLSTSVETPPMKKVPNCIIIVVILLMIAKF